MNALTPLQAAHLKVLKQCNINGYLIVWDFGNPSIICWQGAHVAWAGPL
jgi:hypothetical protein